MTILKAAGARRLRVQYIVDACDFHARCECMLALWYKHIRHGNAVGANGILDQAHRCKFWSREMNSSTILARGFGHYL